MSTVKVRRTRSGPGQPSSLLAADGVWCWFADPRAFRHVGTQDRVYGGMMRFSSATPADIAVFQIDLPTGAVSEFTLSTGFERDDHDNPPLVMWPDGKIQAFWSPHGASPIRHRLTTNPESIAAWDAVQSMPTAVNSATGSSGYTYPNPAILTSEGTPGTGRLYVFWRGQDFYPTFAYSDDRGATWVGPNGNNNSAWSLIAGGVSNRNYVKVVSNGTDRIDLFMTTGHPNNVNTDLHHCYIQGGAIKKTDGTVIRASFAALAASPMAVTELTKVYDHATDGRGWVWDICYDGTGKPVVTFAAMPTPDVNHRYYRAHWNGSAWVVKRIGTVTSSTLYEIPNPNLTSAAVEPYYSGGVMLDHDNPDIVYFAHDTSGAFEIAKAETSDGGDTWTVTDITTGHQYPRKQFRPITVHNHGSNCPVAIWSDGYYGTFADLQAALKCSPAIPGVTQPAEPTNTVAPAITGTLTVGSTLTCSTGTWTGSPTAYRRQWMRNDRIIPGGKTAATYVLTADDVGQEVSCVVMAINGGGLSLAISNAVTP